MGISVVMNDQLLDTPVVELDWPQKATLSLSDACSRLGLEDDLRQIRTDLATLAALSTAVAPVVGITGTLNAGKTSTVKRFLSPEGRKRAPSGIGKTSGTQRFVFWLPTSWKSRPEVWQAFKQGLEALFGNRLEELSDDPVLASRQYQAVDDIAVQINIPLYAFDEGLDQFGFALMDSPDMERGVEGLALDRSSEIRIRLVRQALRGLSAVLVLCEASKAEVELLSSLLTAQQGVPVFLLLNQVDCSPGELERIVSDEGVRELQRSLSVRNVYAAFHGRFHGAREAIAEVVGSEEFDVDLPHFFRVAPPGAEGKPQVLLQNDLASLEPTCLLRNHIKVKESSIRANASTCIEAIEDNLKENRQHLEKLRDHVIKFIRQHVLDPEKNELAIPLLPSTAATIAEAIVQHSPFYAKPTMYLNRQAMKGLKYLGEAKKKLKTITDPGDSIREQASGYKEKINVENIPRFNPKRWALLSQDQKFMPEVDLDTLVKLWTQVGDQAIDTNVELDQTVLKRFAEDLWRGVSLWKKASFAVVGPILLIGALAALVSLVVSPTGLPVVLMFSLNELIVFLGLGTAVTPAFMAGAGKSLEADLIRRAAIPFYENLIKGALDSFGLPRSGLSAVKESFENTGEFVLNLSSAAQYHPVEMVVDLSGGRVLGRLRPDASFRLVGGISESSSEDLVS